MALPIGINLFHWVRIMKRLCYQNTMLVVFFCCLFLACDDPSRIFFKKHCMDPLVPALSADEIKPGSVVVRYQNGKLTLNPHPPWEEKNSPQIMPCEASLPNKIMEDELAFSSRRLDLKKFHKTLPSIKLSKKKSILIKFENVRCEIIDTNSGNGSVEDLLEENSQATEKLINRPGSVYVATHIFKASKALIKIKNGHELTMDSPVGNIEVMNNEEFEINMKESAFAIRMAKIMRNPEYRDGDTGRPYILDNDEPPCSGESVFMTDVESD